MKKQASKRLYILVVSIVLLLCFWGVNSYYQIIAYNYGKGGESDSCITLMSYNIFASNDGFESRTNEMFQLIKSQKVDLIWLNECDKGPSDSLISLLKKQYLYQSEDTRHKTNGDMLFCNYPISYFHCLDDDNHSILYGAYIHISKDDSIKWYGCHLASNNKESGNSAYQSVSSYLKAQVKREHEIQILVDTIQKCPQEPILIMGDMNELSGMRPLRLLEKAGLKDAWWNHGCGYGATFTSGLLPLRIDHAYYNELIDICNVKVIDSDLSDHRPLIIKIKHSNKY